MIHLILSIFVLVPVALVQNVGSVQPDRVSYTSDNDRFDLSDMLKAANQLSRKTLAVEDSVAVSDENYRRQLRDDDLLTPEYPEKLKKKPLAIYFLTRRADGEIEYNRDEFRGIGRAGTSDMLDLEFEDNLKQFMDLPKPSRRKLLVEDDEN